jgi:hypothetical protein
MLVSEIVDSLTVPHLLFHRHYTDSSANEARRYSILRLLLCMNGMTK